MRKKPVDRKKLSEVGKTARVRLCHAEKMQRWWSLYVVMEERRLKASARHLSRFGKPSPSSSPGHSTLSRWSLWDASTNRTLINLRSPRVTYELQRDSLLAWIHCPPRQPDFHWPIDSLTQTKNQTSTMGLFSGARAAPATMPFTATTKRPTPCEFVLSPSLFKTNFTIPL
jgi:hypothetical protein